MSWPYDHWVTTAELTDGRRARIQSRGHQPDHDVAVCQDADHVQIDHDDQRIHAVLLQGRLLPPTPSHVRTQSPVT